MYLASMMYENTQTVCELSSGTATCKLGPGWIVVAVVMETLGIARGLV